jgi:hypothetical protein
MNAIEKLKRDVASSFHSYRVEGAHGLRSLSNKNLALMVVFIAIIGVDYAVTGRTFALITLIILLTAATTAARYKYDAWKARRSAR